MLKIFNVARFSNITFAACVRLVLAVPRALIDVPVLVPALDTALRIGVSYEPLARAAFDALEQWLDCRANALVAIIQHDQTFALESFYLMKED